MNAFRPGFVDDPNPPEPPPVRTETIERAPEPGFFDTTTAPPEAVPAMIPIASRRPVLAHWVGSAPVSASWSQAGRCCR